MKNINNYEFGKITIDNKTYTNDLIILPNKLKTNWWRDKGHLLQVQDLQEVWGIYKEIDKLIIGKGANSVMDIDKQVEDKCKEFNIELIAKKSEDACKYYNNLTEKEKENTVLAIHLTC